MTTSRFKHDRVPLWLLLSNPNHTYRSYPCYYIPFRLFYQPPIFIIKIHPVRHRRVRQKALWFFHEKDRLTTFLPKIDSQPCQHPNFRNYCRNYWNTWSETERGHRKSIERYQRASRTSPPRCPVSGKYREKVRRIVCKFQRGWYHAPCNYSRENAAASFSRVASSSVVPVVNSTKLGALPPRPRGERKGARITMGEALSWKVSWNRRCREIEKRKKTASKLWESLSSCFVILPSRIDRLYREEKRVFGQDARMFSCCLSRLSIIIRRNGDFHR